MSNGEGMEFRNMGYAEPYDKVNFTGVYQLLSTRVLPARLLISRGESTCTYIFNTLVIGTRLGRGRASVQAVVLR